MIITQEKNKQVVQSHDFEQVNCTIDAEDMRYVASLLRNNYSNPALAVVREISANALDANAEANSTKRIEVKLPSSMSPNFSVRDFGSGLSEEDIFGLYSKYGKSTKRTSNNYIGAFGIGKFAPLSYGDSFTCVSYHNGKKTTYNIFVNEDDDTKIARIGDPELTNEPTGLCIEVAVSESDRDNFRNIAKNFFKFFSKKDMPNFVGVEEGFISAPEISIEAKDGSWFFTEEDNSYNYYNRSNNRPKIIMGRVSYPLNSDSIVTDKFFKDDKKKRIVNSILQASNFHLRLPLGSVKLHHSREMLEYNESTQRVLCKYLNKVVDEIQIIAQEKLADSDDLFLAKRNYAKIINTMPYHCKEIFNNAFSWNGIQIDSPAFSRPHDMHEDLIITEFTRDHDTDARDGFKVKSGKVNRLLCQDNCLFMIQNLESAHGNNLRVRTLMTEDADLQVVYVVRAMTSSAENLLWTQWEFNRISEDHIRYSDNVEKQKPNRSGVRKSNGSRADIALFSMKLDRSNCYRNADYWENASSKINEIEDGSEVDGNFDGKLIYVPIKNYKIDYPFDGFNCDLDAMRSRMKKINDSIKKDAPKYALFGVRKIDIKKLDKDLWIDFKDFYKLIAKKLLLDNIDEANRIYTATLISKDKGYDSFDREFYQHLYKIFVANGLNFKDLQDGLFVECLKLYKSYGDRTSHLLIYVNYLLECDKTWVESNLTQKISFADYKSKMIACHEKYPMISLVGSHYSDWRNDAFTHIESVTMIEDYITMCELCG